MKDSRKITSVVFGDSQPRRVTATLDDGSSQSLFSYFTDELYFSEAELVGLTVEEAIAVRHKKDVQYLRS